MNTTMKSLVAILFLSLIACDGPSLEKYYVNHENQDNFLVVNIPTSTLIGDTSKLSAEQVETLQSMKKANILVYPLNDKNKSAFEKEKADLENILKNENYKLLMKFGSSDKQFRLMYEGDPESIDEMVVFGSSDEMGFGVARILGKNMNPGEIMNLMKSLDSTTINIDGMKKLKNIIRSKTEKDSL